MKSGQLERVGRECFLQIVGWRPAQRQIPLLAQCVSRHRTRLLTLTNLNAHTEFRVRTQGHRTRP
jgi:hypothetical protein